MNPQLIPLSPEVRQQRIDDYTKYWSKLYNGSYLILNLAQPCNDALMKIIHTSEQSAEQQIYKSRQELSLSNANLYVLMLDSSWPQQVIAVKDLETQRLKTFDFWINYLKDQNYKGYFILNLRKNYIVSKFHMGTGWDVISSTFKDLANEESGNLILVCKPNQSALKSSNRLIPLTKEVREQRIIEYTTYWKSQDSDYRSFFRILDLGLPCEGALIGSYPANEPVYHIRGKMNLQSPNLYILVTNNISSVADRQVEEEKKRFEGIDLRMKHLAELGRSGYFIISLELRKDNFLIREFPEGTAQDVIEQAFNSVIRGSSDIFVLIFIPQPSLTPTEPSLAPTNTDPRAKFQELIRYYQKDLTGQFAAFRLDVYPEEALLAYNSNRLRVEEELEQLQQKKAYNQVRIIYITKP